MSAFTARSDFDPHWASRMPDGLSSMGTVLLRAWNLSWWANAIRWYGKFQFWIQNFMIIFHHNRIFMIFHIVFFVFWIRILKPWIGPQIDFLLIISGWSWRWLIQHFLQRNQFGKTCSPCHFRWSWTLCDRWDQDRYLSAIISSQQFDHW